MYVSHEYFIILLSTESKGHALAQLVEALRCKPEDRGYDGIFSLTQPFRPHYGPGVDSASNRNEYQEYFLGRKDGRSVRQAT